jgi:Acetyl-coenzyme A transporter 1
VTRHLAWLGIGYDTYSHFSVDFFRVNTIIGSIPFILREQLSYSQLATFALASYPYSLKLFWSPIVDAVYFPSIGRRKSWIIPMQVIIGSMMLWMSFTVQELMDDVCTLFQLVLRSYSN